MAQYISVSVIKATHAVHPVYRAIFSVSGLPNIDDWLSSLVDAEYFRISFLPWGDLRISSIFMNDSFNALK